jgi:hypothetical protein
MLSASEDYKFHTGVQINLKGDSACKMPPFIFIIINTKRE